MLKAWFPVQNGSEVGSDLIGLIYLLDLSIDSRVAYWVVTLGRSLGGLALDYLCLCDLPLSLLSSCHELVSFFSRALQPGCSF